MMYLRNILIAALFLPTQYIAVPILLLTKWDGRSTWWGNSKWGRGTTNPAHSIQGYWQEFVWLTYRNPINNLLNSFGKPAPESYVLTGNPNTGDQTEGGAYAIIADGMWEFYYVRPYLKKYCVRIRLGWKIHGKQPGELCPMVFVIRPIQNYYGS